MLKLRNLGNHQHNCEVLRQKTGDLVVSHQPTENVDYTAYIPCKYCYVYFAKASLWKHSCPLAPDGGKAQKKNA